MTHSDNGDVTFHCPSEIKCPHAFATRYAGQGEYEWYCISCDESFGFTEYDGSYPPEMAKHISDEHLVMRKMLAFEEALKAIAWDNGIDSAQDYATAQLRKYGVKI